MHPTHRFDTDHEVAGLPVVVDLATGDARCDLMTGPERRARARGDAGSADKRRAVLRPILVGPQAAAMNA